MILLCLLLLLWLELGAIAVVLRRCALSSAEEEGVDLGNEHLRRLPVWSVVALGPVSFSWIVVLIAACGEAAMSDSNHDVDVDP